MTAPERKIGRSSFLPLKGGGRRPRAAGRGSILQCFYSNDPSPTRFTRQPSPFRGGRTRRSSVLGRSGGPLLRRLHRGVDAPRGRRKNDLVGAKRVRDRVGDAGRRRHAIAFGKPLGAKGGERRRRLVMENFTLRYLAHG